jgi:hypothetical protein
MESGIRKDREASIGPTQLHARFFLGGAAMKEDEIFRERLEYLRDGYGLIQKDQIWAGLNRAFGDRDYHFSSEENRLVAEYLFLIIDNATPLMMVELLSQVRRIFLNFIRTEEGEAVSINGAVKELGLSRNMVKKLVGCGVLRAFKHGKRNKIFMRDVRSLVAVGSKESLPALSDSGNNEKPARSNVIYLDFNKFRPDSH